MSKFIVVNILSGEALLIRKKDIASITTAIDETVIYMKSGNTPHFHKVYETLYDMAEKLGLEPGKEI